ncbi:hypothetical protein PHMEG_00043 [Phytophthora megakarya]|uniref:TKL protein kinase n=1 Tax=Phytophthora megakarya TaxID=4795 RepID=A0A225X4Q2_9STRA|nr:hypothetical protein PHMEG_00043 [Phytophthora megakarya]
MAKSLVELSAGAVALFTPVQELLIYVEYLPVAIRHQLFHELSNFRLREMEVAWEAAADETSEPRDGFDPQAGDKFLFDRETQRVWELRMKAASLYTQIPIENTAAAQRRRRNYRHVFWEHQFRSLLKLRAPELTSTVDVLVQHQNLFVDVVEVLKVHELGFFHGKLSDKQLAQIRNMLARPMPTLDKGMKANRVTTLELVSVKIRPEGFRQLVGLVTEMPQLTQLRLCSTIADFDTQLLIDAAFRAPKLERLFLEHNDLEDDAFIGLSKMQKPLAIRHLRLSDNDLSSITVGAICGASMDGVLNLERLELTNNVLIGATNLLLALGHNKTVKHLNIAQNFFDVGFGDVLADFLFSNDCR